MKKIHLNIDLLLIIFGAIALIILIGSVFWWSNSIEIIRGQVRNSPTATGPQSIITGLNCPNTEQRPIAVMLANDPVARPLSGISQADMMIEMPVTPDGVTRLMAVFQCTEPKEIGSIRSAREDFIPLAAGLDTIYAHWGGERDALTKLNSGVIDNIDAMKYEGSAFYRVTRLRQPHNGFTTIERLKKTAEKLSYELKNGFIGYPHTDKDPERNISNIADTVAVPYSGVYAVQWAYDAGAKEYKRSRGGQPEIDRLNNTQVTATVVVVMETDSRPINRDYIGIVTTGGGQATIYQKGVAQKGSWHKDPAKLGSKLIFTDLNGKEIAFVPGKIWIEIIISP